MKKKIDLMAVMANLILAVLFAVGLAMNFAVPVWLTVSVLTVMSFALRTEAGSAFEGLQKEIWTS